MKFKQIELEQLLKASYDKQLFDVSNRFIIDIPLSDIRVKVYTVNDLPNELVVIHCDSHDGYDWYDNLSYMKNSDLRYSKTYKMHKKRHKKAFDKYTDYHINVIGHSKGALYATQLHNEKLANQVITYNKPVTDIKTKNDLVSVGKSIVIPSDSINALDEHKTDKLLIGNELFKKTIDYRKFRVHELKDFLKKNKNTIKLDVNLTGLTKPQLVEIVKKVVE